MEPLAKGRFELGDASWGTGTPIIITDGEMPAPEVRDEDAENELGHGGFAGRDRLGFTTWSWEWETNFPDGETMAPALDILAAEWRAGLGLEPGELLPLRYGAFGRTRRVYGRPRAFDGGKPNLLSDWGRAVGAMEFKLLDPFVYDDDFESVELGRLAPASSTGVVLPAVLPFVLGIPEGRSRNTFLISGEAPTPPLVTFHGPVTNPSLSGPDGFLLAMSGAIPAGTQVTIDCRTGSVRRNGTRARGLLRRGSRLKARFRPGETTLTYEGTDETNTSKVVVSWHPAHHQI